MQIVGVNLWLHRHYMQANRSKICLVLRWIYRKSTQLVPNFGVPVRLCPYSSTSTNVLEYFYWRTRVRQLKYSSAPVRIF